MPKKTKEEAELTKLRIMSAAIDEFYENGIASSSIKKIVNRAGLTRGAFYWHFKNKEDILNALLDETIESYQTYFEQLILQDLSPIALLRQHAINLFAQIYSDDKQRKTFSIFMQTIATQKEMPSFHAHSEEVYFSSLTFYEEQFALAIKNKDISGKIKANVLAFGYNAFITGIIDSWFASPTKKNLNISEHAKDLINVFLLPLLND